MMAGQLGGRKEISVTPNDCMLRIIAMNCTNRANITF